MNVGLPGTGIGGLFYVLLVLLMPIVELPRTLRGESSWERWRLIFRQIVFVATILGLMSLFALAIAAAIRVLSSWTNPGAAVNTTVVAVSTLLAALATLTVLLASVQVARLIRWLKGRRSSAARS